MKKHHIIMFILSAVALALGSGCASVARGTTDSLVITSEPSGADVEVHRTNAALTKDEIKSNLGEPRYIQMKQAGQSKNFYGPLTGVTPVNFVLKRKGEYKVIISKAGYSPQTVLVTNSISGKGAAGMAGNVLIGGVIGVGVDAVTGASKDLEPNPVHVNLVKE